MKDESIIEEEKILEILKEFYQVSHVDLKKNVLLDKEKGNINNSLHKLRSEDKIRRIQGLGTLYWRYNLPITTISKKQYRDAIKLIDAYARQMEEELKK